MKLNLNELRKGSLILFQEDDSICIVLGIDADDLGLTVFFTDSAEETWIEATQFAPIPITKEWLMKIGFVKKDNDELLVHLPPEIEEATKGDLGFKRSDFFFNSRLNKWMDCQSRVCVDYIHQVQSLVYWHTRHELTLTK